jgi:type I restriction enzyme, R subunit
VPEIDPILGAVIMDSDRVEKEAAMKIALADTDAEIEPVPTEAGGRKSEPGLDSLSNLLKTFNEHFGTTCADSNRIFTHIRDDIAPKVAADAGSQQQAACGAALGS